MWPFLLWEFMICLWNVISYIGDNLTDLWISQWNTKYLAVLLWMRRHFPWAKPHLPFVPNRSKKLVSTPWVQIQFFVIPQFRTLNRFLLRSLANSLKIKCRTTSANILFQKKNTYRDYICANVEKFSTLTNITGNFNLVSWVKIPKIEKNIILALKWMLDFHSQKIHCQKK